MSRNFIYCCNNTSFQDYSAKNIIFALDRSGSMNGNPLQICKQSIKTIIQNNIGNNDYISLITFSDYINVDFERMQKNKIGVIYERIDNIYADGRTAFYKAIMTAIDISKKLKITPWIIALTDGDYNCEHLGNSNDVIQYMRQLNNINIVIITVGNINNIHNIRQICLNAKKGKHITANNINEIGLSFEKAVEFMMSGVEVEKF